MPTGNESAVHAYHKIAHGAAVMVLVPLTYIFASLSKDGPNILLLIGGLICFEVVVGAIVWFWYRDKQAAKDEPE